MNIIFPLIFLYFLTLSIDLFYVPIFLFKCKITHLVAPLLLLVVLAARMPLQLPKKIFHSFLFIFASLMLSAFLGAHPQRSLGYVGVFLFSFVLYFWLPFNLMQLFDREKIFKLYFLSFICVGCYAAMQCLLSLGGLYDPFAEQRIGSIARGQALTYEPSFFALYMIPFVMLHNTRYLLGEFSSKWKLAAINFLLLVSTSVGGLFSYALFVLTCLFLRLSIKKLFLFSLFFIFVIAGGALVFPSFFMAGFFKFFHSGFFGHGSFLQRWEGIVRCWNLFLEYPLFGIGLGGIGRLLYQRHLFGDDPVVLTDVALNQLEPFDPMNVTTEILASLGLFGAVAIGYFLLLCYRALRPHPALLISSIVMLAALQFNQGLFRPYIWVHLALCLGQAFVARDEIETNGEFTKILN